MSGQLCVPSNDVQATSEPQALVPASVKTVGHPKPPERGIENQFNNRRFTSIIARRRR